MAGTPNGKHKVVNIGTSLVLVVFIILTLVTFAALSAVAASADYQASAATAARATAYYTATAQAEETLAEIDAILQESYKADAAAFPASCLPALAEKGFSITENALLSYSLPVNATQVLFVQLSLHPPKAPSTALYTRVVWQERSLKPWVGDANLPLLQ